MAAFRVEHPGRCERISRDCSMQWRWEESPANRSLVGFPANREKYREILEFGLQIPLAQLPTVMILSEFRWQTLDLNTQRNRE
jgi:hypothetical protein